MGEDGGRVIRVRFSGDPVSRKKGGGALLVILRDTSFGDMSPGWGTTTKNAPWVVRLAPRLPSGAKSLPGPGQERGLTYLTYGAAADKKAERLPLPRKGQFRNPAAAAPGEAPSCRGLQGGDEAPRGEPRGSAS